MACHLSGAFEPHHRLLQWHWQEEGRDLAPVGPCIAFSLYIHLLHAGAVPSRRYLLVGCGGSCTGWNQRRSLRITIHVKLLCATRSPPISLCPSSPDAKGLSKTEKRWRNRVAKERAKAGGGSCSLLFSSYSLAFNMHACEAAKSRAREEPGQSKFSSASVAS